MVNYYSLLPDIKAGVDASPNRGRLDSRKESGAIGFARASIVTTKCILWRVALLL